MFDFGEEFFDWVETGLVFWRKDKFCPGGADGLAHGAGFMGAEIIHDDDITWREGWNQHFLDIDAKALAIDRAVEQPWRLDAVVAQAVRNVMVFQWPKGALPRSRTPRGAQPRSGAMLVFVQVVNKNQPRRIKYGLEFQPLPAPAGNIGAVLFAGGQRLFL